MMRMAGRSTLSTNRTPRSATKMGALVTIGKGMRGFAGAVLFAAIGAAAHAQPTAATPSPAAPAQRTFSSAKDAADAFVIALRTNDEAQLDELFGPLFAELDPTDKIASAADRKRLAEAARELLLLREDARDRVTLVLGAQAWPFPIPIVLRDASWRFDTAAGIEELKNRVVGSHELAAIDLARNYVAAQAEYASEDRDGDQVLEYAQRFASTPGQHDGLHWESKDGEESPFGPFVAAAGDYAKGRRVGDPFKGYYFKVLTRQGPHPPGGAYDYVINGNMIAGFGLLAVPADYGVSGVMTFVVNQQGKVYQKDLGPKTAEIAASINRYDPDASWTEVAE
jgi:hypothetical protein